MPPSATSGSDLKQKPGRKPFHFLVSLFVAIIFWLFNRMSAEYKSDVVVKLNYRFAPEMINTGFLPDEAKLQIQSRGWQLLRLNLKKTDVDIDLQDAKGAGLFIAHQKFDLFAKSLPAGFEILSISPDSILLLIENKVSRKVPIKLKTKITFQKGFGVFDTIQIKPDSITLTGSGSKIPAIGFWETEYIKATGVNKSLEGNIALKESTDPSIILSAVAVKYLIPIGKIDTIEIDSAFIFLQPN